VAGSRATTEPLTSPGSADRPAKAASWAAGSIVSWTLPPLPDWLLSRSTSLVTKSSESSPESTEFSERSTALWLKNEKKPVTGAYLKGWS